MMRSIAVGFVCGVLSTVAAAADERPVVPEALRPLGAEIRGFPGCLGKHGLILKSREPLTAEQWDAVAGIPVTSFLLSGAFVDEDGLARLAKLKVEGLFLTGCRAEDAKAAAAFTAMKSLRRLKGLAKLKRLTMGEVDVSAEDLARLRADLPGVDITHEPMKPGGRTTWENNLEYRRRQAARAAQKATATVESQP